MTNPVKYPLAMRVIHWLMALLILSIFAVGWYMAELPGSDPTKFGYYPWHKSFGVLVLVLVAIRIITRLKYQKAVAIPKEPEVLKAWEKLAAKLAHFGLYVLMLAVPVSGYIMSDAHPKSGVNFFVGKLPNIFPKSETLSGFFHDLHGPLAFSLIALVVIHVAAVIKHRFFDSKEADVLKRML